MTKTVPQQDVKALAVILKTAFVVSRTIFFLRSQAENSTQAAACANEATFNLQRCVISRQ